VVRLCRAQPGAQRSEDGKSICDKTGPLETDCAIGGAPTLRVRLRADRPQANLAVRLGHVHPDGASTRITYGVFNLCHSQGKPLVPGQQEEVELSLDHIAYLVPKGNHLRVAISTAYWPLIWPSPHAAAVTLHSGALGLDTLTAADNWTFPPPDADAPWQTAELRAEAHVRRTEVDHTTGAVSLIIEDDFGKVQDMEHGLINGSVARERWEIRPDNPLSARGTCHWTDELERGDIRLRTEAKCAMWSDATHFHLSAQMQSFENDALVFDQALTDKIPRDLL